MYPFYPSYQSPYPAQVPQIQVMQPQQAPSIQYVDGKKNVESIQMPANSSAIFMDSKEKKFYTKQTDASGSATIKSFDYTESEEEKPVEYVTKSEFESFKAKMKGARNESNNGDARKQQ